MTVGVDERVGHGANQHPEGWGGALLRSAVILVACFIGFIVVPNELLAYLPLHGVAPRPRDAIVAAWVTAWFIAASYLFVRLQRRRIAR